MNRFAGPLAAFAATMMGAAAATGPALAADAWTVDAAGSMLGFEAVHGGNAFTGRFDDWQADIVFSPEDLAGSQVTVTIDMASADAGANDRNSQLPTGDWFDIDNHPTATFVTTGFTHLGGDDYEASAELTIKGVTLPVTLPFTLSIDADTASVSGSLGLVRTDFGVGEGRWADGGTVGLDVTVLIDLTASRQ